MAGGFGIPDARAAVMFLEERRRAAEEFEAFVLAWPSRAQEEARRGVFAEALMLDSLRIAGTDAALTRMKELLATHIAEVVDRCAEAGNLPGQTNGDERGEDASATLRRKGQEALNKFESARRERRRQNKHLARAKATCEALLAGQWLSANLGPLADAFDTEPAAFAFRSTVPFALPEAPLKVAVPALQQESPRSPTSPPPYHPAHPVQEEEGVLRSLFRWLFGSQARPCRSAGSSARIGETAGDEWR